MKKGLAYILLSTYLLLNILNYVGFISYGMNKAGKIIEKYTLEFNSAKSPSKPLTGDSGYIKALYDRVNKDQKDKEVPRNSSNNIQTSTLEYIGSHNSWEHAVFVTEILYHKYTFNLKTIIPDIDSPPPLISSAAALGNDVAVCLQPLQVRLLCIQSINSLVG